MKIRKREEKKMPNAEKNGSNDDFGGCICLFFCVISLDTKRIIKSMTKLTEFHRKKSYFHAWFVCIIFPNLFGHTHTHTPSQRRRKNNIIPKDSFCVHCNDVHSMIFSPCKSNVAEYFRHLDMWSVNRETKRREIKIAKITKQSYDQPFLKPIAQMNPKSEWVCFNFVFSKLFWTEIYLFFASNEIRFYSSVEYFMLTRTKVSFYLSVNCWDLHLIWQNNYSFSGE